MLHVGVRFCSNKLLHHTLPYWMVGTSAHRTILNCEQLFCANFINSFVNDGRYVIRFTFSGVYGKNIIQTSSRFLLNLKSNFLFHKKAYRRRLIWIWMRGGGGEINYILIKYFSGSSGKCSVSVVMQAFKKFTWTQMILDFLIALTSSDERFANFGCIIKCVAAANRSFCALKGLLQFQWKREKVSQSWDVPSINWLYGLRTIYCRLELFRGRLRWGFANFRLCLCEQLHIYHWRRRLP